MFSRRTNWDLSPNLLSQAVNRAKENVRALIDLTESNPTQCDLINMVELLDAMADKRSCFYDPYPKGARLAREAVAAYYAEHGAIVDPDSIVLTASTSEAYSYIFKLLADPGDSILIPKPSYPLLDYLSELESIKTCNYQLIYNGENWSTDFYSIEKEYNSSTRAIVVVNPNNPTGSLLSKEEEIKMLKLCSQQKLALISDEVFLDYAVTSTDEHSSAQTFAANNTALIFTLSGLSKVLALPQLKLGWIVVSGPELMRKEALARLEIIADTYLSVNTSVQYAVCSLMQKRNKIQNAISLRVNSNRKFLVSALMSIEGAKIISFSAGWNAVIWLPNINDEQFALRLLEEQNVLVHPGHLFDFQEDNLIVISLLPKQDIFRNGVQRMVDLLESILT